ncbi:MAG: hypothetical protein LH473_00290 [Chitinophagales bacterium]|nr:hypothetical protein [Chitinophagales bacterium]
MFQRVFGGDALYANVGIKLGSPHIYNIFAAGIAPTKDVTRIGMGVGLGGHIPFKKAYVDIDGICYWIHNGNFNNYNQLNLLNQIRLMGGYSFTKGLAAYAGPVLNVHVYDSSNPAIASNTVFQGGDSQTYVDGWIGFVVGLQFF